MTYACEKLRRISKQVKESDYQTAEKLRNMASVERDAHAQLRSAEYEQLSWMSVTVK